MRQSAEEQAFQKTPFEDMTWAQRVDFVQRLSYYPALTVMVFLRRGLGFRMVRPNTLLILGLLLIAIGKYLPTSDPPPTPTHIYNPVLNDWAMIGFGVAFLILGAIHRRRRWNDFLAGIPWHSHNQGDSWLMPLFAGSWFGRFFPKTDEKKLALSTSAPVLSISAAPSVTAAGSVKAAGSGTGAMLKAAFLAWLKAFPSFLPYHVRRYIDPLVCVIIGIVLMLFVSPKLGTWIVFSGAMLVVYEQARYDKRLDHEFDLQDALWDAENTQESHIHFTRRAPARAARPRAAIPTGRAADTEALSQRRQGQ